jgi:hypothetical protein
MGWSNQVVDLIVLVEESGGFSGIFGYSPSAGPGNLVFSLSVSGGYDPYGNEYQPGLVVGSSSAIQLQINSVGGFAFLYFLLNNAAYTNPNITAEFAAGIPEMLMSGPASKAAGKTDFVTLSMAANDGIAGNFANMDFIYTDANGAAHLYMYVDAAGAHITASDGIAAVKPGTGTSPTNAAQTEVWHSMTSGLENGFGAGSPTPEYKLNADNSVSMAGTITLPASGFNGTTLFQLPAAYFPVSAKRIPVTWNGTTTLSAGTPRLYVDPTGYLQFSGLPSGSSSVWLDGVRYPIDI